MKPRLWCGLALVFSSIAFAGDLDWPAISAQTKPWSRWWWLGNIGTKQDFTTEMEKYAQAGLGGLEITPIYGVRGQEGQFRDYLSPQWMELLDHVLDEGQRLGLGIDMSTGTGWPFGGPWVSPDSAARHVVGETYTVKAGERLAEPVVATDTPIVRLAGPRRVTIGELTDPVTSNKNLQDLALDQVRFPRKASLQALVAVSSNGEKIDLTARVDAAGKLDWVAPAVGRVSAPPSSAAGQTKGGSETRPTSDWTLYAVFLGWHGKQVERAGPGGEGDVIDHFNAGALAKYLKRFDDAYAGHRANRLRAYFNDSYEVDDANGESNWTARFFEEFKRRRGYDLRDELPAFFGQDTPEKNARVMCDHRETISDLLLEEFTVPWAKWAKSHGAIIRNQAHGSPANIIDLYAASDIPETEGNNIIGMKLASSAAHVTGKQLTSAETATWLDEHWVSTLGDIKRRVDQMFLGGVNHNCYHGTVFSPPGEPWPGHHFYAAVELDPSNSIWADADVLNAYVARVQSFLQTGQPANDILLYHPIHDAWMQRGDGAMPHFGGGARAGGQGIAGELHARGCTFDFVTDRLLAGVEFRDGALRTGGVSYKVVVVPEVKFMPAATLERLAALARAGATVIFHKRPPGDVPGLGDLERQRARLRSVGTERFKIGPDIEALLAQAGVRRETLVDRGLQFERRAHEKGHVYFLRNGGEKPIEGWVPLATTTKLSVVFEPMSGRRGVGAVQTGAMGQVETWMQLAPSETVIVKTFTDRDSGSPGFEFFAKARPVPVAGSWTVQFVRGGPTLPGAVTTSELRSWVDFGGDPVKAFAGTAVYTTKWKVARGTGDLMLDLGRVSDSARVKVNGREVGALIEPPWRVVIRRDALHDGENTLEIAVTNVAANRIADLDRRDPSWKKFYNTNYPARIGANRGADGNFSAAKWTPRPAGLLGPVTIAPIATVGVGKLDLE
ncbi:MAG: glycoside hydrolase family 2 protein [Verrucomicrobia bacterium]|nr:glycoside hydrolase family 2 protein [Verrucomicrobiota bacterium]